MPEPEVPSRSRAIRILDDGHRKVGELVDELSPARMTRGGLGGGDWSPRDLVGHLTTWEEFALEALAYWDHDETWPTDARLWSPGVNVVNAEAVARKSKLSTKVILRRSAETHAELIDVIRELTDTRWRQPATSRGRKSLGARLGGILGGPAGPFRHVDAHLRDLRAFVDAR